MNTLFLMVGVPGSGKSTYAKHNLSGIYVSRDEIRFSKLKDGDDYFKYETEVKKEFFNTVKDNLLITDVIADATHISARSRLAFIRSLQKDIGSDFEVVPVVVSADYMTCVERNNMRTGLTKVPVEAINRMYKDYQCPTFTESNMYNEIWFVNTELNYTTIIVREDVE